MADRPTLLLVCDAGERASLSAALSEPGGDGGQVTWGDGGDDTVPLFAQLRPDVVVVTASLDAGDARFLLEVLRADRRSFRAVLIGDGDGGPVRTALDATEFGVDRFVPRPVDDQALRLAVASSLPAPAARSRWEAMADRIGGQDVAPPPAARDPEPGLTFAAPPPLVIRPRRAATAPAHATPARGPAPVPAAAPMPAAAPALAGSMTSAWRPGSTEPGPASAGSGAAPPAAAPVDAPARVREVTEVVGARGLGPDDDELGPGPLPLADLAELDRLVDDLAGMGDRAGADPRPDAGPDALTGGEDDALTGGKDDALTGEDDSLTGEDDSLTGEDDSLTGEDAGLGDAAAIGLAERGDGEPWAAATPVRPVDEPGQVEPVPGRVGEGGVGEDLSSIGDVVAPADDAEVPFGGDFARQLRRKMSAMAERLFRADASGPVPALPVAPRHDHHTEIDLAALVDDGPALGAVTEIVQRERATSQITRDEAPVTGDTQLRGRADSGELVRGQADAAALMARAFASAHTGALELRRGEVEKLVYFDRGRPVFAASNQSHDRMGQLLFREGKITAEQYQRCQSLVAASGRRMGEILVDLGYLKRRELLPAVRRHVEDLVYSVFAWSSGTFRFVAGDGGAGERIRLSRHPSAMILEGIRRKLTEPDLVALVGGPTTVLEIGSAERLAAMVATADLSLEEQAALAAIDGRRDVAAVTRAAAVEPQVVLQLAYGLIVLGVLTARRTADDPDDAPVLVGETDLAIDRERVHARWALVVDADYFALLGVRRDATTFEIRRAYEAARRDFAPDSFPPVLRRELAAELGEIGHVLDEAHRVLRDPGLRASYLRHLVLD